MAQTIGSIGAMVPEIKQLRACLTAAAGSLMVGLSVVLAGNAFAEPLSPYHHSGEPIVLQRPDSERFTFTGQFRFSRPGRPAMAPPATISTSPQATRPAITTGSIPPKPGTDEAPEATVTVTEPEGGDTAQREAEPVLVPSAPKAIARRGTAMPEQRPDPESQSQPALPPPTTAASSPAPETTATAAVAAPEAPVEKPSPTRDAPATAPGLPAPAPPTAPPGPVAALEPAPSPAVPFDPAAPSQAPATAVPVPAEAQPVEPPSAPRTTNTTPGAQKPDLPEQTQQARESRTVARTPTVAQPAAEKANPLPAQAELAPSPAAPSAPATAAPDPTPPAQAQPQDKLAAHSPASGAAATAAPEAPAATRPEAAPPQPKRALPPAAPRTHKLGQKPKVPSQNRRRQHASTRNGAPATPKPRTAAARVHPYKELNPGPSDLPSWGRRAWHPDR